MSRAPVSLPINMARCPATRTKPCAQHETCARALVDGKGREVYDFSAGLRDLKGKCMNYLDAGQYRQQVAGPAPRVHEAPKGLG